MNLTRIMNMKKTAIGLILLTGLACATSPAEELKLEDQIAGIKVKIQEQEALQQQLEADISARDEEVAKLKEQLKELEKKIGG